MGIEKFHFIPPELATISNSPPLGLNWLHEVKFDGYRMQVHIAKGKVRIFSRYGKDWTKTFHKLALEFSNFPDVVLDGEIVVLDKNGRSDFQLLQKAIRRHSSANFIFYAFDILAQKKSSLLDLKLIERKKLLAKLMLKYGSSLIRLSEYFPGPRGRDLFALAEKNNLEGIISKLKDGKYKSGRSRNWLKTKTTQYESFLVGGVVKNYHGYVVALLVGEVESGKFKYLATIERGFSILFKRQFTELIKGIQRKTSPFINLKKAEHVIWIKPQYQVCISYLERTDSGKLRDAVFKGDLQKNTKD